MASRIEEYGLIGDCQSAALVGPDGSIDWLCLPRFDSSACFAALLGGREHGRWLLAPEHAERPVDRRYREDTLVVETTWRTHQGTLEVLDFMPPRQGSPKVVRIATCVQGEVDVVSELAPRFDYGRVRPWMRRSGDDWVSIAGPDSLWLRTSAPVELRDASYRSVVRLREGEQVAFTLAYTGSFELPPETAESGSALADALGSLRETDEFWHEWVKACRYDGVYRDPVVRSLITLKALTYAPTGGIVAAATTSLPETLGGVRNWDYRYCWLRDATVTLRALVTAGFHEEAAAWQHWLLRATAGDPSQTQILYGVAGEHRVPESTLDWLPGYAGSAPVRIGNAAVEQFQLDVYGEVLSALHHARAAGVLIADDAWDTQVRLLDHLGRIWREPDEGLWEVRVGRRQFTHSKVMCWVAYDSSIRSAEEFGLPAPLDAWRATRDRIHADVCANGYDAELGAFTQYYGSRTVDASGLLIPLSGFLPADDPRVVSTVAVIERELMRDGLLARYRTLDGAVDGLPGDEGAFVPCTLWLAGCYALRGDYHRAAELYERVLALRGVFGLLAEEVDPRTGRHLGNTPQAYSHVAMVLAAHLLEAARVRQVSDLRSARATRQAAPAELAHASAAA